MNDAPRSRLLLLELVCDLVLFVLCAVVCVALLVQARGMSRRSTELTQAVYLAQEAAESGASETYAADGYEIRVTHTAGQVAYEVLRDGRSLYVLEREVFS